MGNMTCYNKTPEGDRYNIYLMPARAFLYTRGLTYEELLEAVKEKGGTGSVEALPARLARARDKGTSSMVHKDLWDLLKYNRMGKGKSPMLVEKCIEVYLT